MADFLMAAHPSNGYSAVQAATAPETGSMGMRSAKGDRGGSRRALNAWTVSQMPLAAAFSLLETIECCVRYAHPCLSRSFIAQAARRANCGVPACDIADLIRPPASDNRRPGKDLHRPAIRLYRADAR